MIKVVTIISLIFSGVLCVLTIIGILACDPEEERDVRRILGLMFVSIALILGTLIAILAGGYLNV